MRDSPVKPSEETAQAVQLAQSVRFSNRADAPEHARKAHYVRQEIMREGERLRVRYPVLQRKYESALSALVMASCLSAMVLTGYAYVMGGLPGWAAFVINAVLASIIHELEHDLIHWMYFRKTPWAHHLMLALGLIARPTTVRPWVRRSAHLNHHQNSGQEEDIEERAITNGQPWSLLRLLMLADLPFAIAMHTLAQPGWRQKIWYVGYVGGALFPLGILSWGMWYLFLGFHFVDAVFAPQWSATWLQVMSVVNVAVVVWVAPNILRTFCLNFLSSNMHYFGDVQRGNLIQETQVLDAWFLFPLQLFSFNVGQTHGIHHFVVREPFWIRQFTMKRAHQVMREAGVRFNDFQAFRRANRWALDTGQGDRGTGAPAVNS